MRYGGDSFHVPFKQSVVYMFCIEGLIVVSRCLEAQDDCQSSNPVVFVHFIFTSGIALLSL